MRETRWGKIFVVICVVIGMISLELISAKVIITAMDWFTACDNEKLGNTELKEELLQTNDKIVATYCRANYFVKWLAVIGAIIILCQPFFLLNLLFQSLKSRKLKKEKLKRRLKLLKKELKEQKGMDFI